METHVSMIQSVALFPSLEENLGRADSFKPTEWLS